MIKLHLYKYFMLILLSLLMFSGCSKNDSTKESYVVGVNIYMQHPILDQVLEGMKGQLKGQSVRLDVKNANKDNNTVLHINQQFVMRKVDAIVALGTPSAQNAVEHADGIPVVFGAITDPVGSKLAESIEKPGGNKTGTTNRWPFEDQVALVAKLFPKAVVGLLVSPSEANCVAGMAIIRAEAEKHGLKLVEVGITNTPDVMAATASLKGRCDLILITPSNVLFSGLDALIKTAEKNGVPVMGGDTTAVEKGSVATLAFSNHDVGIMTADLLMKVLNREKFEKVGDLPVEGPPESELVVNDAMARKYGIDLSSVNKNGR